MSVCYDILATNKATRRKEKEASLRMPGQGRGRKTYGTGEREGRRRGKRRKPERTEEKAPSCWSVKARASGWAASRRCQCLWLRSDGSSVHLASDRH